MPPCTACKRDDVPRAPAFPRSLPFPPLVAHVTLQHEPCKDSMGETYDLETKQVIVAEDGLWDLGEYDAPQTEAPKAIGPILPAIKKPTGRRSKRAPAKPAAADAKEEDPEGDSSIDDWIP